MTEQRAGYEALGQPMPGIGPVIAITVWRGHVFAVRATDDDPSALFVMHPDVGVWKRITLGAEP